MHRLHAARRLATLDVNDRIGVYFLKAAHCCNDPKRRSGLRSGFKDISGLADPIQASDAKFSNFLLR